MGHPAGGGAVMIGQEIPSIPRMPDRYPTGAERSIWEKAKRLAEGLSDRVTILRLQGINAGITWSFAQRQGIDLQKPIELEKRTIDLEEKVNRVIHLIRKVEDHNLAIQYTGDDIDIVDPGDQNFGFPFVVVGIGVVVLAGLVGTLLYYKSEYDEIRPKYNNLLVATDRMFCKDASPETCAEWTRYKEDTGYTKRRTLVERITDGLGAATRTGAKWGLTIGIPLIIGWLMWSARK